MCTHENVSSAVREEPVTNRNHFDNGIIIISVREILTIRCNESMKTPDNSGDQYMTQSGE